MVLGPTLDYIPEEIASGELYASPQAAACASTPTTSSPTRSRPARRPTSSTPPSGRARRCAAACSARTGQTVDDAVILTRQQIDPINLTWQGHSFIHARDGRFELHGFDPEKSAPAYFLDADHEWGAAVELSGKQAGEELTVRLQPCGRARARFVGPDGKPVARLNV